MQFSSLLGLAMSGFAALTSAAPTAPGASINDVSTLYSRALASMPQDLLPRDDQPAAADVPNEKQFLMTIVYMNMCHQADGSLSVQMCALQLLQAKPSDYNKYDIKGVPDSEEKELLSDKDRLKWATHVYTQFFPSSFPSKDAAEDVQKEIVKEGDELEEQPLPTPAAVEAGTTDNGKAAPVLKQSSMDKLLDKLSETLGKIPVIGEPIRKWVADRKAKQMAEQAKHTRSDESAKKAEEKEGSAPSGMSA